MCLAFGYDEKVDYVRIIVVAELLWSEWYARLPGVARTEELCEAPLNRIVHLMAAQPHKCMFKQVDDLFMLCLLVRQSLKDAMYYD